MKKKIVSILVCLCILCFASLLSCGSGDQGEKKEEKITLKIWESEGVEKDFMLAIAEDYKASHPDIEIVYEPVPAPDSRSKIELDGPAGVGADIFVAPHDQIGALVAGGHVLPLDSMEFLKNFIFAAVMSSGYGGKAYGYPLAIETYALFYNKDILPTPPETWEEIEAFAKTWNDKAQNKYALVWEVGNAYFDYIFMSGFNAPLFGPKGNDRTQHNINSANAITGLKYFQSLRKKYSMFPQPM
ncbi:ABC transporter, solute-binding protein [Treponema phagedenis F0421]|nr:extracellular solute-binding protein [Treponema phagedenis]EFW36943.1 ABC transporter, solute-binding protein [Treponema phagedenis F0421]